MTGYQYLQDLFTAVLSQSKGIQGRFFVCPKYGHEINTDQLSQVLQDDINPAIGPKYPLALMMPPTSLGMFNQDDLWEGNRITLFFLKTTYYNGDNTISNVNPNTQTSRHTILQDWHDMKRCAVSFLRAIEAIQDNLILTQRFYLGQKGRRVITPVSLIGADRVSGVRLDFEAVLFTGCEIEDYPEDFLNSIVLPAADSHPEHKM